LENLLTSLCNPNFPTSGVGNNRCHEFFEVSFTEYNINQCTSAVSQGYMDLFTDVADHGYVLEGTKIKDNPQT